VTHYHAVVWIDHHQARIYHFNAEDIEALRVLPENPHVHLHHHRGSITDGHAQEDKHYYHRVAEAIADAGEVLVAGRGWRKASSSSIWKPMIPPGARRSSAPRRSITRPTISSSPMPGNISASPIACGPSAADQAKLVL